MKITKVRTNEKNFGTPQSVELDMVMEQIKSQKFKELADKLTNASYNATLDACYNGRKTDGRLSAADRLPYLVFSSTFKRKSVSDFLSPTGLLLLTIDSGRNIERRGEIFSDLIQLPQTMAAFIGASGATLKVLVRCVTPGGTVPTRADEYVSFLRKAQEQVAQYYEIRCGCSIVRRELSLTCGCRISSDSGAYYNPAAQSMTIIDSETRTLENYHGTAVNEDGTFDKSSVWQRREREREDFYTCMRVAMEKTYGKGIISNTGNDGEEMLGTLALLCRQSGLAEETAVQKTLWHPAVNVGADSVRKIFRTIYGKVSKGKPQACMNEKERIARRVREFFERRYEVRYNVLKRTEEVRERDGRYLQWRQLSERELRKIAFEQMLDVSVAWSIDVELYVRSTLIKDYNPIHEFLAGCGKWRKSHDYIREFARRVPTKYEGWEEMFHCWFLAMVAQWLNCDTTFGNSLVPMIIGRQGTHKSTFCKIILPPVLREYYIDDVKMDNAEQVERVLGRMALVNIDEYNAKTDREQAKIKRLLTEKEVQVRRMRSDQYVMTPRMASFIATTNETQPLNDPTGSRRYICCELSGVIDTATPVNYQQLYAQAIDELQNGAKYYLTKDEEKKLEEHNKAYQRIETAEMLLTYYFQPAERNKKNFVKATDVMDELRQHVKSTDMPTLKSLTTALKQAGFAHGAIEGVRGWYVKKV